VPPDPFLAPYPSPMPGEMQQVPPGVPPPAATPGGTGYLTAPSAAYGQQMKRRGPFLVWFVWPLITLGIYHYVWYYKIHREMHDFDTRRDVPVSGPVLVLIFLGWTVVAPLISYYNTGKRIADAQRSAGMAPTVSPVLGMLLMIVLGLGTLYYQAELNKITAVYGYAIPGTMVPLAF